MAAMWLFAKLLWTLVTIDVAYAGIVGGVKVDAGVGRYDGDDVIATTMTSSRRRRATLAVLLLAVAVVNCRRRDLDVDEEDRHRSLALGRARAAALVAATRRHRPGHLPGIPSAADDKRGWRDNRVRVWGKRTTLRDNNVDDDDDDDDKRGWHENTVRVWVAWWQCVGLTRS